MMVGMRRGCLPRHTDADAAAQAQAPDCVRRRRCHRRRRCRCSRRRQRHWR